MSEELSKNLGVMTLNIEGKDWELKPELGDKRKLLKAVFKAKKDEVGLIDFINDFSIDLFQKTYPEKSKTELAIFVENNLVELLEKMMIGFKLTTEKQLKEASDESKKKD